MVFFSTPRAGYIFGGSVVGCITVAAGVFVDGSAVAPDFYVAVATAIPVLLLALFVVIGTATDRLALMREEYGRTASEFSAEFEKITRALQDALPEVEELEEDLKKAEMLARELAHEPEGDALGVKVKELRAIVEEARSGYSKNQAKLEGIRQVEVLERSWERTASVLKSLLGASFVVSLFGEGAALYALATRSSDVPFCLSVLGLVAIFVLLFILEADQLRMRQLVVQASALHLKR